MKVVLLLSVLLGLALCLHGKYMISVFLYEICWQACMFENKFDYKCIRKEESLLEERFKTNVNI